MSTLAATILIGLLLGGAFGALVHRTHFCTMGALADLALFGDTRRLRAWLLAIGVALTLTQLLVLAGVLAPTPQQAAPGVVSALLGGVVFGYGMTLTGGCVSRSLVRTGTGSLKALVTLFVVGLTAAATLDGVLAPLRHALDGLVALPVLPAQAAWPGVLGGLALTAWCLRDARFRVARRELAAGVGIGLLATLGWLAASGSSLSFMSGIAALDEALALGTRASAFLIAMTLAVPLGAFAAARSAGDFRIEGFSDSLDLRRHLTGGVLMGLGGGLAVGCTIGQGVSGVAVMALPGWVALAGFLLGGLAGVRALEHGSLRGAIRARFAGISL